MSDKKLIKIFGIKNCDSCKKTLKLIAAKTEHYEFIDIRKQPLSNSQLTRWCKYFGMQNFVNRRSTTWRALNDDQKAFSQVSQAVTLVQSHPTLMKRPITTLGTEAVLGHNAELITALIDS